MQAINHLLDYYDSNPNPKKIYKASQMVLTVHSEVAYGVAPEAKSRAGG